MASLRADMDGAIFLVRTHFDLADTAIGAQPVVKPCSILVETCAVKAGDTPRQGEAGNDGR